MTPDRTQSSVPQMKFTYAMSAPLAGALVFLLSACASSGGVGSADCASGQSLGEINNALKAFQADHKSDIREIRLSEQFIGGETVHGRMQRARAVTALERLAYDFQSDVVSRIDASETDCASNLDAGEMFLDYLKREGVGRTAREWAEPLAAGL